MDIQLLQERARIIQGIRSFFDHHYYLEVDTPLLAPNLIPETCLEVFRTDYLAPALSARPQKPYWLIPSPELWMKRLIADHRTNMYQLCRCFRNGESMGRLHSPEFTMLEYYTMDADYKDSLGLTEELFRTLLPKKAPKKLRPPFIVMTMDEAFIRYAGFSLQTALEEGREALEAQAIRLGLEHTERLDLGDIYNLIFVHTVESSLPTERPVALMDYPAVVPCLAKTGTENWTKERWELYVGGIELANCYTEENDPEEVRRYFQQESILKNAHALVPHEIDSEYWKLFLPRKGQDGQLLAFPHCSGVAMGVDRLIMAITGRKTIDLVLPFSMS